MDWTFPFYEKDDQVREFTALPKHTCPKPVDRSSRS